VATLAIHPQRRISQIQENPSIFWLSYGTFSKYGKFSRRTANSQKFLYMGLTGIFFWVAK
jgi:hypothetical protein